MSKITYPKQIRQYNITAELGHGAYSTVCKAFSKVNRRNFAIKIFPKTNLQEQGGSERFQREINSMACLRHDNLVALYDFFWDELNFYMVIDFCPGGELFDYIVKHDKLDEPVAALIFKQIVSAISFCHERGLAHRDLKPENVLIDRFPHVKISDFGLCGFINNNELMKTFCGSPAYCAPECLSKLQYDGRLSDVWSLGVILFCMVTGDHPWNCSNTSQMLRQILSCSYTIPDFLSEQCRDLLSKMLLSNPNDRIRPDQILEHEWLEFASNAKIKMPPKPRNIDSGNSTLPPLREFSMGDLHSMMVDSANASDSGIFSPFDNQESKEHTDEDEEDQPISLSKARMPSLPTLCVRSSSIENFMKMHSKNINKQSLSNTMKRYQPKQQLSMTMNRQRSAVSLLPKLPPKRPKPTLDSIQEQS